VPLEAVEVALFPPDCRLLCATQWATPHCQASRLTRPIYTSRSINIVATISRPVSRESRPESHCPGREDAGGSRTGRVPLLRRESVQGQHPRG
jgi:hypothetical protein